MKTKPVRKPKKQEPAEKWSEVESSRSSDQRDAPLIDMVPLVLQLKSILVPLDFSDSAEKALHYAVAFGQQFEARITLLHVQQIPIYPADLTFVPVSPAMEATPSLPLKERLEADARRLIPAAMMGPRLLRVGVPFDETCKVAEEIGSDLIIVSTHGYTGFRHVLMGSTAERIVRHAPCPVLVVRETEREFA